MANGSWQDFDKVDVKIESVIAELIDNSAARNPDRIDVVLRRDSNNVRIGINLNHHESPYVEDFSDYFSISVFNDGNSFDSIEHLHESFELSKKPGEELDRSDIDNGLFHVGMKESTLNKFHHFSIVTEIDSEKHIRSIIYPGQRHEFLYDWASYPNFGSNPKNKLPDHVEIDWINKYMAENKFVTCAHASAPRECLTQELIANHDDLQFMPDFAATITHFFGMLYYQDLIDKKFSINVICIDEENNIIGKPMKVAPIDLFWEQTTPKNILKMANNTDITKKSKYICETIYGYGTLKGHTSEIKIDLDGVIAKFEFTPFLLPHNKIRKKLMEVTTEWNGYKLINNPGDLISSGPILSSEWLQGVSFVRSGRIIVIGNHGGAKNDGFYKLGQFGLPINASKARLRFKIEYSKGNYTDRLFSLKPNKDGYKEIKSQVWKKIMKKLSLDIDGSSQRMFYPHNRAAPFYLKGDTERHLSGKFGTDKDSFTKAILKKQKCSNPGCGLWHGKSQKCLKRPCDKCGQSLYSSTCTASVCHYTCSKCDLDGHLEINCKKDWCKTCNLQHCRCCTECDTQIVNGVCKCPCDDCGEMIVDGSCGCPLPPPPQPIPVPGLPGDEDPAHGLPSTIRWYPSSKESAIMAIKKIMEGSNIEFDDLN